MNIKLFLCLSFFGALIFGCSIKSGQIPATEVYQPNWESLRQHETPQWALDAKFGIYAHWGPYSVVGSWTDIPYANWGNYYATPHQGIYNTDPAEARRKAFEKRFGPITSGAGYKDICKTFTAKGFNAAQLADLIKESGAQYAGICAVHHDGYAMWDSEITPHCAGKTGAKRDLLGEILGELKKRNLKTIATFHHARTYGQFNRRAKQFINEGIKGIDLNDPAQEEYYWFLGSEERFAKNRKALTYEVIDKYHPDMLWFDGGGDRFGTEEILAHYFNQAKANHQEVAVQNKANFGNNFGIYSYENGAYRPGFVDWPWCDDTPSAVGWCDWSWWYGIQYKKPREVILQLVDVVARNGSLLLSLNPRPDGSLDEGQIDLLKGIGQWLKQNCEAIYGTRPWNIYAEGHVEPVFWQGGKCIIPHHYAYGKEARPIQPDTRQFDASDIRFTVKDNQLFAIQLGIPAQRTTIIRSLGFSNNISSTNKIKEIELLGYGSVEYLRTKEALEISLPENLPNQVALAFKITVEGKLVQRAKPEKGKPIPFYAPGNSPEKKKQQVKS